MARVVEGCKMNRKGFWHQDVGLLARGWEPKLIVGAQGSVLYDQWGNSYIDGISGLINVNIGHGRKAMADAIAHQLKDLAYFSTCMGFANVPAIELANKLTELAPGSLSHVLFSNSGSEAVETALKLARQYFKLKGHQCKFKTIAMRNAYHGVTFGAMSASGQTVMRSPFEPLLNGFVRVGIPYCYRCEFGLAYPECDLRCVRAIEETIRFEDPSTVAAVILEPLHGGAGLFVPPDEYMPILRDICNRFGILLVVDEVASGFGRSGEMFGINHWDVVPDMMVLGKGLASGYLPMAATVVQEEIFETFGSANTAFPHVHTTGGHPACCSAALKSIEIIEGENLVAKARENGEYLRSKLEGLSRHEIVGEVRGLGLYYAVELVENRATRKKFAPELRMNDVIHNGAFELGLYTRSKYDGIVYLCPPLIIEKEEIDEMVNILDELIEIIAQGEGQQFLAPGRGLRRRGLEGITTQGQKFGE